VLTTVAWCILASGAITALGGVATFAAPRRVARAVFDVERVPDSMLFFVRHWGILIFAVGGLVVYAAYVPATRLPILSAAIVEKVCVGVLVWSGPVRPTKLMNLAAIGDALFSILYAVSLGFAGLG
jgi:uncharacterized protein YjeT (DUF2065 family)